MVQLTAEQENRLQEAFRSFDAERARATSVETSAVFDVDFCGDWPTAKGILEFLIGLPTMPEVAKGAMRVVIQAGDLAHGAICGR